MRSQERAGLNISIVGLIMLLVLLILSGETVEKERSFINSESFTFSLIYLVPRDTKIILEVEPSTADLSLMLLDEENMARFLKGQSFTPLAEHRGFSGGVILESTPGRGIYGLYMENPSKNAVSVRTRIIMTGMMMDALALSLTLISSGIIIILISLLKREKSGRG